MYCTLVSFYFVFSFQICLSYCIVSFVVLFLVICSGAESLNLETEICTLCTDNKVANDARTGCSKCTAGEKFNPVSEACEAEYALASCLPNEYAADGICQLCTLDRVALPDKTGSALL